MQAQSALGRSGRIMGGTLMIGVAPFQDDANMNNSSQILDQSISASQAVVHDSSHITNLSSHLGTPRSIRPLTRAYKVAQSEHEVSHNLSNSNV